MLTSCVVSTTSAVSCYLASMVKNLVR